MDESIHIGGGQFSPILAAEVCAAVLMLDTPCYEVVRIVLATHSIRQFPFHTPTARRRVPSHFNCALPAVWMWCPQNASDCGQFAQLLITTTSQTNTRTAVLQKLSTHFLQYIEPTRSTTVTTDSHNNPHHPLPPHKFSIPFNINQGPQQ
jgi:hypothetical protein